MERGRTEWSGLKKRARDYRIISVMVETDRQTENIKIMPIDEIRRREIKWKQRY